EDGIRDPLVTGVQTCALPIFMQLFAGAKIINLNLQDDEDKSVYQGTQKFLVIVMIFVEAVPQVFGFLTPASGFVSSLNGSLFFEIGRASCRERVWVWVCAGRV